MARENVYLGLEFGSGMLYEFSKVEKEGFEKKISKNNNISYRKYHKQGAFGVLKGISVRPGKLGDQLSIALEGANDTMYYVNLGLRDGNSAIDTYASAIISYMPNLIVGEPYKVQPWAMERKDNPEKKNYGVSIKYANIETQEYDNVTAIPRLSFSYYKEGVLVAGDVPAGEWKKKAGKDFLDTTDKDEYLWNVLEKYKTESSSEDRGTYVHVPSSTAPVQPAAKPVGNPVQGGAIANAQATFDKPVQTVADAVAEDEDSEKLPF